MGKNWTIADEEGEKSFKVFAKLGMPKNLAKTMAYLFQNETIDEEEAEIEEQYNVFVYKTLRYPTGSTPPTTN